MADREPDPEMQPNAHGRRRKLRVLHVINGLGRGGAETVLYRLVTHSPHVEHEVISLAPPDWYSRKLQEHGIAVHTIAPGAVETAMFRQIMSADQYSPDKTLRPEDVADVIARCVTGELAHTRGEVIYLHKTL